MHFGHHTFDHEEETLVAALSGLLERAQRRLGHLAQAGVDVVHIATVELKGDVVIGEEAHHGQGNLLLALPELVKGGAVVDIVPAELLLCNLDHIDIVLATASRIAAG